MPGSGKILFLKAFSDVSGRLRLFSLLEPWIFHLEEKFGRKIQLEGLIAAGRGECRGGEPLRFQAGQRRGNLVGGDAYKFLAGREEGNLVRVDPLRFLLDREENNCKEETHGRVALVSSFIVRSLYNLGTL